MLGHLIRKEILDHISGLRFLILSAVGALAIWLSLYDGYAYYQDRLMDYRFAQAMTEERIRQLMVADNWTEISSVGFSEHKLPTTVSIFVRGFEPPLGRLAQVRGRISQLKRSQVSAELIRGVFPLLDLGLIVRIVLSLFVLLLT